jgi:hypothetical protein
MIVDSFVIFIITELRILNTYNLDEWAMYEINLISKKKPHMTNMQGFFFIKKCFEIIDSLLL